MNNQEPKTEITLIERVATGQKLLMVTSLIAGLAVGGTFLAGIITGINDLWPVHLWVKLNSATPKSQEIAPGTTNFEFARFDFTTKKDVQVDRITFSNIGSTGNLPEANTSETSIINIKLFETGTDNQIGKTVANLLNGRAVFEDLNWRLLARTTKTISLIADVSAEAEGTVAFGFNPAQNVKAKVIASGRKARVRPRHIIQGNLMMARENTAFQVFLDNNSPSGTITNANQIDLVWYGFMYYNINDENMRLEEVTFTKSGTIANESLTNIGFYNGPANPDNNPIAMVPTISSDNTITFSNLDYLIPNFSSIWFTLAADVSGNEGDAVQIGIQSPFDVKTVGVDSGQLILPSFDDFPVNGNVLTITRTLKTGDLFRGSDYETIYYLARDGYRYPFYKNEGYDSFLTWYKDDSEVITVSDEVIASYALGQSTIGYRPGTKLLKLADKPEIYTVEPTNVLREIKTDVFTALGYDESMVDVMPDWMFTQYTLGEPIDSLEHPNGTIFKYPGSDEIYYLYYLEKRPITPQGFAANNLYEEYVLEISESFAYETSAAAFIDGYVNFISDPVLLCLDTDATQAYPDGKNYYLKGKVTYPCFLNPYCTTEPDRCLDNELEEKYCYSNLKPDTVYFICPGICSDGACLEEAEETEPTPGEEPISSR